MRSHILAGLAAILSSACDASVFDTKIERPHPNDARTDSARQEPDAGRTPDAPLTSDDDAGTSQLPVKGAAGSGGAKSQGQAGAAGGAKQPAAAKTCEPSCSAAHARGMCEAGECVYSCESGYADCDANSGNGCEVSVTDDAEDCGGCGQVCPAAPRSLAQCRDAKCQQLGLVAEPGQTLAAHGTALQSMTTQLCPTGSVLAGLEGFVVDTMIADSMRILCRALTLTGSARAPSIAVGEVSAPVEEYVGGADRESNAKDPVPVPYRLSCDAGEVVKQLRVSVWTHWADANGRKYETVKDVAIACAAPVIEAGALGFGPLSALQTTSATLQLEASPARDELDGCGDNELFLGFTFGSVANIDMLKSTCIALRLRATPGTSP